MIDVLNTHINRALKQADVRERLNALGLVPVEGTVAEFSRLYQNEVARWARVSREAGVKIE